MICNDCFGKGYVLTGKRGRPPKCKACGGTGSVGERASDYRSYRSESDSTSSAKSKWSHPYCRDCYTDLSEKWGFCPMCGVKRTLAPPPPPPPPPFCWTCGKAHTGFCAPPPPPPRKPDPWGVLGISFNAPYSEAKSKWRSVARELHPDLHPTDKQEFTAKFQAAQAAWDTLEKWYRDQGRV